MIRRIELTRLICGILADEGVTMRELTGKNAKGVGQPLSAVKLLPRGVGQPPSAVNARRGAALVLVVTLLAILLALGLTFLAITRIETQNSTNTINNTRSEMLGDGAIAQAVQTLNVDFSQHPNATSPDHAWRSYYSGTWAAGKLWMTGKDTNGDGIPDYFPPLWNATMPAVDLFNYFKQFPALSAYLGSPKEVLIRFSDGHMETLYQGPRTRPWLYYPRAESVTNGNPINPIILATPPRPIIYDPNVTLWIDNGGTLQLIDTQNAPGYALFFFLDMDKPTPADPISFIGDNVLSPAQLPFILPNLYAASPLNLFALPTTGDVDGQMYAKEIVDKWADVDNDGDGLKDSIWIPIGQDIPLSNDGVDSDLDGMVDESQTNNANDDIATEIDPVGNPIVDGIDTNSDGTIDDFDHDEGRETGIFVYHGMGEFVDVGGVMQRLGDGLDNDGINGTDDAGENNWFLTSPLPGIRIPVDLNGDGNPGDLVPVDLVDSSGNPGRDGAPDGMRPLMIRMEDEIIVQTINGPQRLSARNVDVLDNDYDGLVNDYEAYAYFGPNRGFIAPFTFEKISIFNDNGLNKSLIELNDTKVNQSIQPTATVPSPPFYQHYDIWRHPHNWIGPDQDLFAAQRSRAYADINIDLVDFDISSLGTFDPPSDLNFDPPISDWLSATTLFSIDGSPGVGSGALSPPLNNLVGPGLLIRSIRISHSGEAVSELVGRAAIYISDEASKVNLNVAGYQTYNDETGMDPGTYPVPAIYRTVTAQSGTIPGPAQYDTRFLPYIGVGESREFYNYLTGGVDNTTAPSPYVYDVAFPGYGRVDDNGDALLMAFDRIDNDADGYIDEGLWVNWGLGGFSTDSKVHCWAIFNAGGPSGLWTGLPVGAMPPPLVGTEIIDANYYTGQIIRLGSLEGVDDPGELQHFNPTRNLIAEGVDISGGTLDAVDNDGDGVSNEIGELADRMFHKKEQMETQVPGIGSVKTDALSPLTTVNSSDLNVTFASTKEGIRGVQALDMNEATPQQIAQNMMITGEFAPVTNRSDLFNTPSPEAKEALAYALGLRQADVSLTAPDPDPDPDPDPFANDDGFDGGTLYFYDAAGLGQPPLVRLTNLLDPSLPGTFAAPATVGPQHGLPADPQLQALQVAANIRDNIDADHTRTLLRTENRMLDVPNPPLSTFPNGWDDVNLAWLQLEGMDSIPFPFISDMNEHERINPSELFSVQSFEDFAKEALGYDITSGQLQNIDLWWKNYASINNNVGGDPFNAAIASEGVLARDDGVNLIPEERRITNAVAGVESVVINELMVRAVRRVEAEAVPNEGLLTIAGLDAGDPINTAVLNATVIAGNIDPTPFGDSLVENPPASGLFTSVVPSPVITPDFDVRRRDARKIISPIVLPALPDVTNTWQLVGDVLGDTAGLRTQSRNFQVPNANDLVTVGGSNLDIGEFVEFIIMPSDGLPGGRYYLTINTGDTVNVQELDLNGNGNLDDDINPFPLPPLPPSHLQYSIKYVQTNIAGLPVDTLIDDVRSMINNYAPNANQPDFVETEYFSNFWKDLPWRHIANNPGEAEGWAYLDGTPLSFVPPSPNPYLLVEEATYFTDGGGLGGLPPTANPAVNTTHTVTIPPFVDVDGNGIADFAICIGIRISPNNPRIALGTQQLDINFLEFSQEPDHEYIELHNISDQWVTMGDSGDSNTAWHLEIGIPGTSVSKDPYGSKWEIPAGTSISPKGYLLLTAGTKNTDKFDDYQINAMPDNLFSANGMGLATQTVAGVEQVTVPPIKDMTATLPFTGNTSLLFGDFDAFIDPRFELASYLAPFSVEKRMSGSVFDPGESEIPYIDDNGDGVSSVVSVVDAAMNADLNGNANGIAGDASGEFNKSRIPDTDNAGNIISFNAVPLIVPPTPVLSVGGGGPWARIIQLENIRVDQIDPLNPTYPDNNAASLSDYDTVNHIARMVLRGGILPNYPEHDGIDNDGDGAYLANYNTYYKYVPGILDKDMVDNDLDGVVDEQDLRAVNAENVNFNWWDFDGVDNDGDLVTDEADTTEAPAPNPLYPANPPWATDGIDNDGDNLFDEFDEQNIIPPDAINPAYLVLGDPFMSEGVDEGDYSGWLLDSLGSGYSDPVSGTGTPYTGYGLGAYEDTRFPVRFYSSRENYKAYQGYLNGLYSGPYTDNANNTANVGDAIGINTVGSITFLANTDVVEKDLDVAPYLGSALDPPDWKAYAQRKWNPGDNVIVTLYDGDPDRGAGVVDRVTYREYDVINRTIDDIAPSPYPVSLSGDYPSFWLPNQMGLDFYRALERKAPTYRGDRFGTSNRWEATDGNYDDWADSLSFFERMVDVANNFPNVEVNSTTFGGASVIPRFTNVFTGPANMRTLYHALWGSPLRMNTAHRMSENPPDMLRVMDYEITGPPSVYAIPYYTIVDQNTNTEYNARHPQFAGTFSSDAKIYMDTALWPYLPSIRNPSTYGNYMGGVYLALMQANGNVEPEFVINRDWTYGKANVRNAPMDSAADVMSVPFSQYSHQMVNVPYATGFTDFFLFSMQDVNRLNYMETENGGTFDVYTQYDISQRGQILGVNDGAYQVAQAMLDNAVASFSNDSVTLTVAQADFKPVFGVDVTDTDWDRSGGGFEAPYAWTPIYLFDNDPASPAQVLYPDGLDGTLGFLFSPVYIFDLVNYAFNAPVNSMFAGGFIDPTSPDYYNRWPAEKRISMYVSQDDPNLGLPEAEALFTWDEEDGLENGEYILYVHTFVPGSFHVIGANGFSSTDVWCWNPPCPPNNPNNPTNPYDENLVTIYGYNSNDPISFGRDLLAKDPKQSMMPASNYLLQYAVLELDVITNRENTTPAAIDDDPGTPGLQVCPSCLPIYEADINGRILYADNTTFGVKPIVVKVTDNFLSLRVRNHRDNTNPNISNNVASISHITLSPRLKTPGRININTAETSLTEVGSSYEFFNPILGLPGVINAYDTVHLPEKFIDPTLNNSGENLGEPIGSGDGVALSDPSTYPVLKDNPPQWVLPEWPSPVEFLNVSGARPPMLLPPTENIQTQIDPPTDMLMPPPAIANPPFLPTANPLSFAGTNPDVGYFSAAQSEDEMTALRLMSLILEGRKEHADGRYYDTKADLMRDSSRFVVRRDLDGDGVLTQLPNQQLETSSLYPLSNENDPEVRFREIQARYRQMGNLITTRSDTFEIIATVQAGHVDDTNNDGVANYRTADFTVQGETKTRVVYERRTPAGNTTD